uniref:Calponin-homology (CH) domain-containing protein n=1 Tax=Terrapene triunguis TaxID=2587831 RepID=A0A674K1W1_9SAUR
PRAHTWCVAGRGQGSDRSAFDPVDEREAVQKKTFTKWVNSHLARVSCRISDLYADLRDGYMLTKLLEVLSGEQLLSPGRAGSLRGTGDGGAGGAVLRPLPVAPSPSRRAGACGSTRWRTWTRPCSS